MKASTAQVRRRRFRALFYTTTASLAVLFVLYVCYRSGEWLLNRLVYENPTYAIRTLDIQTDGVIASDQIRRWAGVKQGDNLFALDLARIKRDLELAPVIQSVAVERVLPNTLRIHVVEREPVAQIVTTVLKAGAAAQNVVYLLDAEGHAMLPLESRHRAVPVTPFEQYPFITGANLAELSPGRQVESVQIRAAMRLIAAFEQSPMAGLVELQRIDVSSHEVIVVTTDQRSEVVLRVTDLERQLNRWRLVYETGQQQGRQIASLDLSVMDNIPLRWMDAGGVAPAGLKPKKISPYRKKHV
ncbi:MAG: FtsQ-type POTRA domain-containing protein [Verrucomicrobia bacterium]|nr:FtsQ-type POTRA domain-containing protein [Verrucomicrobiota bacterium]